MSESSDCEIYDLVEYRLKRNVDSFFQGSQEWERAMHILLLYLEGKIKVRWCTEGIIITQPEDELEDPEDRIEILVPSPPY